MAPTRLQKRWSSRLRTFGILLIILGVVAAADRWVGLGSASSVTSIGNDTPPSLVIAIIILLGGIGLYGLGRHFR